MTMSVTATPAKMAEYVKMIMLTTPVTVEMAGMAETVNIRKPWLSLVLRIVSLVHCSIVFGTFSHLDFSFLDSSV